MTIKELKFVVRASSERKEDDTGEVSMKAAPVGVVAGLLEAINKFARATGADLQQSQVGFFEGSLGLNYQADADSQGYIPPEVTIGQQHFTGGYKADDAYFVLIHDVELLARRSGVDVDVTAGEEDLHITPSRPAGLLLRQEVWLTSELSLYGEVTDLGGKTPNIHLAGDDGNKYTIYLTKQQAKDFKVYERYYVRVEAKTLLDDDARRKEFRLLFYEELDTKGDITAEEFIRREKDKWTDVRDASEWVRQTYRSGDDD